MGASRAAMAVRITGSVQGVGYRDFTQRQAQRLGIVGWVRNERDGSVAALLVGQPGALAAMVESLWQGPHAASVRDVTVEEARPETSYADFRIVT